MNRDPATIPVEAVIAYLEANGWHREHELRDGRGWTYRIGGFALMEGRQVTVAAQDMADYGRRLQELVHEVAEHEGRSPEAVLWDIAPTLDMQLARDCSEGDTRRRRWSIGGEAWGWGPTAVLHEANGKRVWLASCYGRGYGDEALSTDLSCVEQIQAHIDTLEGLKCFIESQDFHAKSSPRDGTSPPIAPKP